MAEFSPFRWIVLEPLPDLTARSDIFEPILYVEIFLLDATRPESLDEKSFSVILARCVVRSLDLNHRTPRQSDSVWRLQSMVYFAG